MGRGKAILGDKELQEKLLSSPFPRLILKMQDSCGCFFLERNTAVVGRGGVAELHINVYLALGETSPKEQINFIQRMCLNKSSISGILNRYLKGGERKGEAAVHNHLFILKNFENKPPQSNGDP